MKSPSGEKTTHENDAFNEKSSLSNNSLKREIKKKPIGKPKRPLSAYNLFFKLERDLIVNGCDNTFNDNDKYKDDLVATNDCFSNTRNNCKHVFTRDEVKRVAPCYMSTLNKRTIRKAHGKIAFADLARTIGMKWKSLGDDAKRVFEELAREEKERYDMEIKAWKDAQNEKSKQNDVYIQKHSEDQGTIEKEVHEQKRMTGVIHYDSASLEEQSFETFGNPELVEDFANGDNGLLEIPLIDPFDVCEYDGDFQNLFDDGPLPQVGTQYPFTSIPIMAEDVANQNSVKVTNVIPCTFQRKQYFTRASSLPCDTKLSYHRKDRSFPYNNCMFSVESLGQETRTIRRSMLQPRRMSLSYLDQMNYKQNVEDCEFLNNNRRKTHMKPNTKSDFFMGDDEINDFVELMSGSVRNSVLYNTSSNSERKLLSSSSLHDMRRISKTCKVNNILYHQNYNKNFLNTQESDLSVPKVKSPVVDYQRHIALESLQDRFSGLQQYDLQPQPSKNYVRMRELRETTMDEMSGELYDDGNETESVDTEMNVESEIGYFEYNNLI